MKKPVYLLPIAVLVSTYLLSLSITSAQPRIVDSTIHYVLRSLSLQSGEEGAVSALSDSLEDHVFPSVVCGDEDSHSSTSFNLNAIPAEDANDDVVPSLLSVLEKACSDPSYLISLLVQAQLQVLFKN